MTTATAAVSFSIFFALLFFISLGIIIRLRNSERAVERGLEIFRSTVAFLEGLNSYDPEMAPDMLKKTIAEELRQVLKPLNIHSRLWILDRSWKTLEGVGEHSALKRGSPNHLPMNACPAFVNRKPFEYSLESQTPCPSEQFDYQHHLCLPIAINDEQFGVIFLASYRRERWDAQQQHFFEMLAQSIAFALQRKQLFRRLEENIKDLNFSFEVGSTALNTFDGSTQSLQETTTRLLDGTRSILHVDRASLMVWQETTQSLQTQWCRGEPTLLQSPLKLEEGEGMAGWALKTRKPYWAEYAVSDPHYVPSAHPIQSLLCVPMFTMNLQPLGVINAVTLSTPRVFDEREIKVLVAFGQQAALAIENARLHARHRDNIDRLEDSNETKSRFLSLVSHDLRGPLTGIRGFGEVLKLETLGKLNTAQKELLESLEQQVQLQERMVDDLLDFARMEKGKFSIHPSETNLQSLIDQEVQKSQRDARERGVTLTTTTAPLSSQPRFIVDGGRIRQVLWNLIHNAIKFTPEGGTILVRATVDASKAVIEVEDTGVGLSPDTQEHLFDHFFQVTPGGSKGAQGLGLGLAICREIVHAHQGTIDARSPGLGLGTTIRFTLHAEAQSLAA